MFNKIFYSISFYFFCVFIVSAMCPDILADETIQVSVYGQDFDTKNFFALEEMGFRKDKVNFNKGWLGIFMENAEGQGILVKEVTQGSPAAEAGLKAGDIITKINDESTIGKDEFNLIQFKKTIEAIGTGGVPVLTVCRDNAEMVFKPRLFGKLLKNVHEPVTSFISKVGHELTKVDKNTPFLSPPCEGGDGRMENLSPNEELKTPSNSKHTGTSFIEFAIKNERYKDVLGATLQRIGEEAYVREGFQSNEETNPFRLSMVNYFMLHPFDTSKIGQVIVDTFCSKDICAQIEYVAGLLDVTSNNLNITSEITSSPPLSTGNNLKDFSSTSSSSLPCEGDNVKDFHFTTPLSPPCEGGERGVVMKSPKVSPDIDQTQKREATDPLQGQLQLIIDSLAPSVSLIKEAFGNLPQEELEFLYQNAHKIWLPDEKIETQDLARLLALSQKVNLSKLFEAASVLLGKLVPGHSEQGIDALKKTHPGDLLSIDRIPSPGGRGFGGGGTELLQDFAGDILFVQDTTIGKIIVGGEGTSYYYADAAVIIDLGGNDYYFNNAGSSSKDIPVAICIDLSGDDVYNASGPFSQGTGRFGIGLLADFRGNDKYVSQDFSQGSCLFGIGVLRDNDGNDFYSGHVANQGMGFFGAGLLNDLSGNDVYFSRQFAQGVGFTKGFGVLVDSCGNDFYFAGGEYPDFRDPEKSFQSMSQGMGMGIRPEESIVGASGGIGMLIDQKGTDQYRGDYFSQGSGYYYSLGLLCDKEGNDTYYAGRYAQGAGIHSAIGLLKDTSGDDTYECTYGVSQGCGHDTGIGFLVDDCGNDTYRSETSSQGVGLEKGIGVLADFYGNDVYQANGNSQGVSSPSKTEEISGVGILIDNQGDHDIFHDTIAENLLLYRSDWGLVLNR
ncbi:MAG: PDZ domain-containing protein [Candidatus Brocadia sp.]|nr:PDZ domain-containing protein [Candidatus Brocadia sp.]